MSWGFNWGKVGTGALMVIGALVWLGVGLLAERIFIYPIILGAIGLFTMLSGVLGSDNTELH